MTASSPLWRSGMAECSVAERALRAELGELRALNAEVALRCELYAEQVTALGALERDSADLERRSADLELVSVAREAAQRAHSLFDLTSTPWAGLVPCEVGDLVEEGF